MDSFNFDVEQTQQSMREKIEDMSGNYRSVVDDHTVPHWSGEPSLFVSYDPHSKSPQDPLNDVGRNMHSMDVTELVLLGKEETSFSFWSDQSLVMQECFPDVNHDCVFPPDQFLQVDGDYKDLDMMFRNSPMFEQQSSAAVDNIPWTSSTSNIVCSSSGTLKLGSHSESRKLGIMNTVPNQNSTNTNPLSEDCLSTVDLGKDQSLDSQSHSSLNDAGNRRDSEEKINMKFKDLEWQFAAEEKSNSQPSEVPDSQSNWHGIYPHVVPMEYNFPFCQTQLAQIDSSIESEKDNNPSLPYEALVHATSCSRQYTDLLPDPMEKKMQKQSLRKPSYLDAPNAYFVREPYQVFPSGHVSEYDVGNAKMDLLGCEMETPSISEESSIASTLSNDDLLTVVSFQQLQDVLCQLNYKAKQCIRDGLHRMATRTEKGNCFMNSYDDTADHTPRKGANDIEFSEADINLFDRSVALLLFQNSSVPDTNAVSCHIK
ncbi:hypothetical protein IHE45_19G037900 [Dioscorea alata]|uniref:Uncharacterized protein n=8 Tax=Dioscorea alata TaxID=55571 RepID=A0ACB7TXH5_DIOAL|nr:hypothetical protein IHE45_19G037900 [Dioscorea alata]KAH7652753.1 hypothetical protein IHE45_19G037900 [Dioscorea alata]KAH7652754.1 hypothetical protein IHE45_19G037900 [Dioscorea alata]KAH7652755.1 hypothetical protein IHE45_19G037900 [Dioscorea alata]